MPYNITINPPNGSPRSFLGQRFPRTWDNSPETCFYVGDGQGGPGGKFIGEDEDFRGRSARTVIEGRYTDYIVDSLFQTEFLYEEWESDCVP